MSSAARHPTLGPRPGAGAAATGVTRLDVLETIVEQMTDDDLLAELAAVEPKTDVASLLAGECERRGLA